jgi:hypothetical protein
LISEEPFFDRGKLPVPLVSLPNSGRDSYDDDHQSLAYRKAKYFHDLNVCGLSEIYTFTGNKVHVPTKPIFINHSRISLGQNHVH